MPSSYKKLKLEKAQYVHAKFAKDVFLGLMRSQKVMSSKYMYNSNGSLIYEKIMDLPEYYLVKSEYNCLENAKTEFYQYLEKFQFNLIELGSGNGYKTKILLKQFLDDNLQFTYIPVDISESAMKGLVDYLNVNFPNLNTKGLVADYFDAIEEINNNADGKKNVVLFLGSNIGNFSFEEAVDFIFTLWRALNPYDYVLIGFDLRKEIEVMRQAYNDPHGITSDFNLNVLTRINEELGGNFDITKFQHYEPYNVHTGAMESYLISIEDQDVYIKKLERTFHFRKWEPIFMEHSYKYTIEDIDDLASITGFQVLQHFYDENKQFVNSLWCTKKQ